MNLISLAFDCRLFLIGIFGVAGLSKLRADTAEPLGQLITIAVGMRPPNYFSKVLGVSEVGVALWLATGWWCVSGLTCAAALLTVFTIVIKRALNRGHTGGCGCLGARSMSRSLSVVDVGLNLLLIAATLVAIALYSGPFGIAPASIVAISMANIVEIGAAVVILGALLVMGREIELFQRSRRSDRTAAMED